MPVQSRLVDDAHSSSFSSVFDFSYSTYNLNGLSAYHNGTPARLARHNRIIANIRALALTSHIIFLQETHLNHMDFVSLNHILKGWMVFYSNKNSKSGGGYSHFSSRSQ